ncbi:MAG: type II secretion system protein [Nitrospiraceae bacterium]|jgi:prepilin-type N-terminal cleavage/methylation domain-containing protein|nr:type II secretion system GspH family protein [Nitrospirota bacterium]MDA8338897.1 type II secretion system protein [Nitrospiraceae bacterium]
MRIFRRILPQRGFTLIELAMVLVVIGLLIGLGMSLIGPLTKRAKYTETKEIVSAAVESVISYGAANNKLPDSAAFPTVVRNPNDAFTKPLVYIYDNNLTNISIGGICGRKTTAITVGSTPNAAFVVVSGSDDYEVQTTPNTSGAYSGNVTVSEDDIVKWVTLDELRIKAGCVGSQLKILNNELPYGFEGSSYTATIYADGGVPFTSTNMYRWCFTGLPAWITNPSPSCTPGCSPMANDEANWANSVNNGITLSGTAQIGTSNITVYVRDNNDGNTGTANDNCAQKMLVLTINPSAAPPSDPCSGSGIDVRNETGNDRGYKVNGGACQEWKKNQNITVTSGNTYDIYSGESCAGPSSCSTTYSTQKGYDSDDDCKTQMTNISPCTFADR